MRKSNFVLSVAIAVAALALSFLLQHRAGAKLRQNDNFLQQQQDDIAQTMAANQLLSNRVAQAHQAAADNNRAADAIVELAQLQAKAAALRSQENQLSNQLWNSRVSAGERLLASENYNLTNHSDELRISFAGGPREDGKLNDARAVTAALQRYAQDHAGLFPASLDQASVYLPLPSRKLKPWENAPVSGTNDFEIVYQGTTNELTDIPLRRVALIRERQPWLTPDGKWARVYGYADGAVSAVESDDNFQSWDALHIIPPSN